jgi:hypothetical protein
VNQLALNDAACKLAMSVPNLRKLAAVGEAPTHEREVMTATGKKRTYLMFYTAELMAFMDERGRLAARPPSIEAAAERSANR